MFHLSQYRMIVAISISFIAQTATAQSFEGEFVTGKSFDASSTTALKSACVCRMSCLVQPKCTAVSWTPSANGVDCSFTELDPITLTDSETARSFIKKATTIRPPVKTYYISGHGSMTGDTSILNKICLDAKPSSNGMLAVVLTDAERADMLTQLGLHGLELWTGLKWVNGIFTYHTGATITPDIDILSSALKDIPAVGKECMAMKDSSNFHARSCMDPISKRVLCMYLT